MKSPNLGVMIDMSRNAVMTLQSLKDFIQILNKFGYKTIMLYTEDTYEVEGEPYFGYLRGRYSIDDLCEIDAFTSSLGMELIPCIQTLAHLNAFTRWDKVPFDIDDILLVDEKRTYEFIESLFRTTRKCFKTNKIHIGMDEAWKLGRGKHTNIYGHEPAADIMKRHLEAVVGIAEKYNYTPMIWSDMFFRSWNNNQYYIEHENIPEYIKNSIPDGVSLVYWDYYNKDEAHFDLMIRNHKQLTNNVCFAGGAWSWMGITPQNRYSIDGMVPAMSSCRKNGIKNILMTLWGDDGGECSRFAMLPSLLHIAEAARGNTDIDSIKAKFKRIIGIDYDDFMKLDLPNEVCENIGSRNPAKYMLYSDLFLGFLDYTVAEGVSSKYAEYEKTLNDIKKKSRKWGYLFDIQAKLCHIHSIKYELGVKTRTAYKNGNKISLKSFAEKDYPELISAINSFYKVYRKWWYNENRASGFDIQDMRLGGLIKRIDSCRIRLLDYLAGRIPEIEELDADILPIGNRGEPIHMNRFSMYSSVNVVN